MSLLLVDLWGIGPNVSARFSFIGCLDYEKYLRFPSIKKSRTLSTIINAYMFHFHSNFVIEIRMRYIAKLCATSV